MKKVYLVFIGVFFLFLCSCNTEHLQTDSSESAALAKPAASETEPVAITEESTTTATEPATAVAETTPTTIKKCKNYRIDDLGPIDNGYEKYRYSIINNEGKVMYEEDWGAKNPDFTYLSKDLLEMHIGGGNVSYFQYYDAKENRVSPVYENPVMIEKDNTVTVLMNNNRIVFMEWEGDQLKLVVRDLFDKSKFYKEYKRDFSPVGQACGALTSAKFINSNKLYITYLTGSDYKEVSETIKLGQHRIMHVFDDNFHKTAFDG